jgi:hypothetical protein
MTLILISVLPLVKFDKGVSPELVKTSFEQIVEDNQIDTYTFNEKELRTNP